MEKSEIVSEVGLYNYVKGLNIDESRVKIVNHEETTEGIYWTFLIDDDINSVIRVQAGAITGYTCSCNAFRKEQVCEHIARHMIVFNADVKEELDIEKISSSIVDDVLIQHNNTQYFKVGLKFNFSDYTSIVSVKPKIGMDKLNSIGASTKFKHFAMLYKYNDNKYPPLEVGKGLFYNPNTVKFRGKYKKIMDFLVESYFKQKNSYVSDGRALDITYQEFEYLVELLDGDSFQVENYKNCTRIIEASPYDIKITKVDDKYNFSIDFDTAINLDANYNYVYKDEIYKLPIDIKRICRALDNNDINTLVLEEEKAIKLSKLLYTDIKDNLIVEDSISDKFIIKIPKVKMYFDFKDKIVGDVKFSYDDEKEINYYDEKELYRNDAFEDNVVEDLIDYGFLKENNYFSLTKMDDVVNFIEKTIFELGEKYEVFSTKKLKDTSIINKANISSNFSIGKDNIMTYDFDLGDISKKELKRVFESIKLKNKYYKLKNGKILNTSDKSLKQLQEVYEVLDIDYDNTSGQIPKYRALYLDSVKDYGIINTGGMFDEFIKNFNKYKDVDITLKEDDKKLLRDYQLVGVKWLYNIYKCGLGGILADEMGLGKTIQTIMFIKQILKDDPSHKILIVAPTSLIYNWEAEFLKFGSELKYKVIANNKEQRLKDLESDSNVFITTYGLLRQDEDVYTSKEFEVIVIDEGQNIKNPKAGISKVLKKVKGNVKIALTGTPVENSVLEVWSIFDFIMNGYLNNLTNFQSKYNIKNDIDGKEDILRTLSNLIKPFILRRRKKDVLVSLPDKINNDIYIDLLPEQKKLYASVVKESKKEFEDIMAREGFMKARFKVLQLLTRLRQLCIDPSLLYENYKDCSVKMNEIINMLQEYIDNGHKVLIFSSFKSGLDILREKLNNNGITNYMIDGTVSSKNRTKMVDAFNKDNTNAFLITLKAGGTGLNLTSADIVIHLDLWWNPAAENQATDRAHRIGQINKVEVVRLICKGTIEEKIVKLQDKKKILNDVLIESDSDINISKLEENDIIELLSYSE